MQTILLAVDASKGADACVDVCARIFSPKPPKSVILLSVQQIGGGPTVMHDRSESEIKTLKEDLSGSEFLESLQEKANSILAHHTKQLQGHGINSVKSVIKIGHISEEILNTAKEEGAEMIIIGNTRNLMAKLMMGDVTKEVVKQAEIPVLLAQ